MARAILVALLGGFLSGCGQPPRSPAALAGAAEPPAPDAVRVELHGRGDDRWTLRDRDGAFVCALPCAYWVRPDSGMTLRLEALRKGPVVDPTSFELPARLPALPGERLTLTVDRTHALGRTGEFLAVPLAVTFGLMGAGFTAISLASLATGSKDTTTRASGCTGVRSPDGAVSATGCTEETSHGVAAGVGGLTFGVAALSVAAVCTAWFFHARDGGLRYEEEPPTAAAGPLRLGLRAGALELEAGRARARLSPAGITGAF
jgi:hypothetical protein